MVIVATLLLLMLISSVLVLSACMLSAQNMEPERDGNLTLEIGRRWSGTNFGGRYATVVPSCRFEPEDLEEFRVAHRS